MFKPSHPFYEYGQMQLFLAKRGSEIVGRVAAIRNNLYNQTHGCKTGFFGFFECINDQNAANALLDAAKTWLQKQGLNRMHGPASPSSNYEFGALCEGFDDAPRIMMSYNPAYYIQLYANYGLPIAKTLYAYKLDAETVAKNEKLKRGLDIATKRYHIELKPLNLSDMANEVKKVKAIYNAAWEKNWGYVPLSEREIDAMAAELKPIADPAFILFGYVDGELAGMAVAVRDYNYILKQLRGSLWPFGFLKFFTQRKKIEWVRILLLGLLPKFRGKALDAAFYHELIQVGVKNGIRYAEGSWILEDNEMINRGMQLINGVVYKKYHVYELPI
jgi:hypothetical protein